MAVSLLMGVVLQAKEVTAQQALGLAKQFRQTQMAKDGVGAKVASLLLYPQDTISGLSPTKFSTLSPTACTR